MKMKTVLALSALLVSTVAACASPIVDDPGDCACLPPTDPPAETTS